MKKINKDSKGNINSKVSAKTHLDYEDLNKEHEKIINWLEGVKFRKQLIGGVNEQDVWKKIHELNKMYEAALRAERIRYDVLLEEREKRYESKPNIEGPRKESSSYE